MNHEHMNSFSETLQTHPIVGSVITIGCIFVSAFIKFITFSPVFIEVGLPLIVMDIAQLLAWLSAVVVGVITVFGFFKKKKK